MRFAAFWTLFVYFAHGLAAQPVPALVGGIFEASVPTIQGRDFSPSGVLRVAPGQIVTLLVSQAVDDIPPLNNEIPFGLVATTVPLPTEVAGISIRLRQLYGVRDVPVPIFSVQRTDACTPYATGLLSSPVTVDALGITCTPLAAVTVQIPFELGPNIPGSNGVTFGNIAALTVRYHGQLGQSIGLNPVQSDPHILQVCCGGPAVTHADGTLVSSLAPARGGEPLVLYLTGLGVYTADASPLLKTGQPSPVLAIPDFDIRQLFSLRFGYLTAGSSATPPGAKPMTPDFVGLTPGQIGINQVNFRLPAVPPNTQPCGEDIPANMRLTIKAARANHTESAEFCVLP